MTSSISPSALKGSCLCNSITYISTVLPASLTHCHCLTCRRLSGAPFLSFFDFPSSAIMFVSTKTLKTLRLSSAAERAFCTSCGSPVYMKYMAEPESIGIAAGTVHEDSVGEGDLEEMMQRKSKHIFVGKKAGWYTLGEDGLKRYEKFSDGFPVED